MHLTTLTTLALFLVLVQVQIQATSAKTTIRIRRKSGVVRLPSHSLVAANKRHGLGLDLPSLVDLVNHGDFLFSARVSVADQHFDVDLDTGSSDLWLRGPNCKAWDGSCGSHTPAINTTVDSLKPTGESFSAHYGSGSVAGQVYSGPVSLANISTTLKFGVSTRERGFKTSPAGLWGLAFPALNQIEGGNFVDSAGVHSFSFYFSDSRDKEEGELTVNGMDSSRIQGDLFWVPITSRSYYQFTPTQGSFRINDKVIPIPEGSSAISDTGTSLMLVPNDISDSINAAIGARPFDAPSGLHVIDCNILKTGPSILQYVLDAGVAGLCVSGISRIGELGKHGINYIFGDTFLRAAYTVHDLVNNRIGFAQSVHHPLP
ncbi:acid protease [Rhizoclosmatium globosum]|uniref:Acid protease n=1 Tax=Rhizoclosmatium globosum TaxID=329046 RepID=A0A1Y2C3V2_9FUNG|nr:acid protease [Rhizoclosmatium globosum]|eukprot:ORY41681.1 acid protease [Rhizoclosmatium globosum]